MSKDVLLITQTRQSDTKEFVNAIREEFDSTNLIIYGIGRKRRDFTRTLKRVGIRNVIYDIDVIQSKGNTPNMEYLRDFESTFEDCNVLNNCIYTDRKLIKNGQVGLFNREQSQFNYEDMLLQVEVRLRALEKIFNEHEFEFVFGRRTEVLAGMIAYYLAEQRSIPFFRKQRTRIQDVELLNNGPYERNDAVWNEYNRVLNDKKNHPQYENAVNYIKSVRNGGRLYHYPNKHQRSNIYPTRETIGYLIRLIISERGGLTTEYYYDTPKIRYLGYKLYKLMNRHKLNLFNTFDDEIIQRVDLDYIYFPLHAQPEVNLMLWTKYFEEQRQVARWLGRSIPVDVKLLVNDHPTQWGSRSYDYYLQLRDIYNTFVISRSVDSTPLIKNAKAVATISSSIGFEALIHGTPVLTFGRKETAPFYAGFESVQVVKDLYNLPEHVDRCINSTVNEEEIISYVAAVLHVGSSRKEEDFFNSLIRQANYYF